MNDATTVTMPISEYEKLVKAIEDLQKELDMANEEAAHNTIIVFKKDEQLLAAIDLIKVLIRGWAMEDEAKELFNKILALQDVK